jgi:hypothetical protein
MYTAIQGATELEVSLYYILYNKLLVKAHYRSITSSSGSSSTSRARGPTSARRGSSISSFSSTPSSYSATTTSAYNSYNSFGFSDMYNELLSTMRMEPEHSPPTTPNLPSHSPAAESPQIEEVRVLRVAQSNKQDAHVTSSYIFRRTSRTPILFYMPRCIGRSSLHTLQSQLLFYVYSPRSSTQTKMSFGS